MWRDIPAICQTCQEAERVERRMWSPPWRIIQFFFISFSSHSLVLPVTLCLRFSTFMVCISVWILILNVLQTGSQLLHSAKSHIQGSAALPLPTALSSCSPPPPPRTPRPPWAQTTVLPATPAAGQRIITRQLYNNARPLLTLLQPAIIIPGGAGGHLGVHMVWLEKKAGKVRDSIKGLICYSLYKELQYLRARTKKIYTARRKQTQKSSGTTMTSSAVGFGAVTRRLRNYSLPSRT